MKLAASNIGWAEEYDEQMYSFLEREGFVGLEIAPTRIIQPKPYEHREQARAFAERLRKEYHLAIPSMQSIWFGRQEKLFGKQEEREALFAYTCEAILFAEAVQCGNLVFGCPKNRICGEQCDFAVIHDFFRRLGEFAYEHHTVLAMEANPVVYGTDYINKTKQALELVKAVDIQGFRINLDFGTILYNQEDMQEISETLPYVNHIHISEPLLVPIQRRPEHAELADFLHDCGYNAYVSVEMGRTESLQEIQEAVCYIKEIFYDV